MPVTDREFDSLVERISHIENKIAGIEANYALVKFALPTLISLGALMFAIYRSG